MICESNGGASGWTGSTKAISVVKGAGQPAVGTTLKSGKNREVTFIHRDPSIRTRGGLPDAADVWQEPPLSCGLTWKSQVKSGIPGVLPFRPLKFPLKSQRTMEPANEVSSQKWWRWLRTKATREPTCCKLWHN
jgi:hypothetical protein